MNIRSSSTTSTCTSLVYTQASKTDTIWIGGIATGAKSYSYGALTVGPSALCSITYSYVVKNNANTDVTSTLSSFISVSPIGASTTTSFSISIAASTDNSIAAGSPYVVTVTAELTSLPAYPIYDYLTLTVNNACTGSSTAAA